MDNGRFCIFHPGAAVVGVCALCLKERLLVLAARQSRQAHRGSFSRALDIKPCAAIRKVFAFGPSFLQHLESRDAQDFASNGDSGSGSVSDDSTESLDDSFISIKFDNGQFFWDKKGADSAAISSFAGHYCSASSQSLVGNTKRHRGKIRWCERLSRLLRLPQWKRTGKTSMSNLSLMGGNKVGGASCRRTKLLAMP